ncbi:hypothetical protein ABZ714_07955 [Streptomyces sp. NPDC006798]|uniref:hypothetical protein n=1 Tax=Streptomyces sp. NPDC006798 TaxID=3155462 RepID=UPI0033C0CCC3
MEPRHLYYTAFVVRDGQFDDDKGATAPVGVLDKYTQAEYRARNMCGPGGQPLPAVIQNPPGYGPVNDIKWSGTGEDADSRAISGALGEIPDFLADVIRPAIEHGLRLGKMHEITPGARDDEFRNMASAWEAAAKAAKAAADGFSTDRAAADAAVEKYHQAFSDAAGRLKALEIELDEAILGAPTFRAEAARTEAYGARTLNDFKKEHGWQRPESPGPYKYSIGLATEAELYGGHSIDKHMGLPTRS